MRIYLAALLLLMQTVAWAGDKVIDDPALAEEMMKKSPPPSVDARVENNKKNLNSSDEIELVAGKTSGEHGEFVEFISPVVHVYVNSAMQGWQVFCGHKSEGKYKSFNVSDLFINTGNEPLGSFPLDGGAPPIAAGPPIMETEVQSFVFGANIDLSKCPEGEYRGKLELVICGEDRREYHCFVKYRCIIPSFVIMWVDGDFNFGEVVRGLDNFSSDVVKLTLITNMSKYKLEGSISKLYNTQTHESFDESNFALGSGNNPQEARAAAEYAQIGQNSFIWPSVKSYYYERYFCAKVNFTNIYPNGNYRGLFTINASSNCN